MKDGAGGKTYPASNADNRFPQPGDAIVIELRSAGLLRNAVQRAVLRLMARSIHQQVFDEGEIGKRLNDHAVHHLGLAGQLGDTVDPHRARAAVKFFTVVPDGNIRAGRI